MQALVWMRPWVSVTGTRCTRWPPDSNFSPAKAPALDADHDLLVAAEIGEIFGHDLGAPAMAFGVAQVHAGQVCGEQGRLVAAGAGADLDKGVALVVRVARQQGGLQLLIEALAYPAVPARILHWPGFAELVILIGCASTSRRASARSCSRSQVGVVERQHAR